MCSNIRIDDFLKFLELIKPALLRKQRLSALSKISRQSSSTVSTRFFSFLLPHELGRSVLILLRRNFIMNYYFIAETFLVCCETFLVCCETFLVCCETFLVCCETFLVCCETFPVYCETFPVWYETLLKM